MLHRPYYVIDNKCNKCLRGTRPYGSFALTNIEVRLTQMPTNGYKTDQESELAFHANGVFTLTETQTDKMGKEPNGNLC